MHKCRSMACFRDIHEVQLLQGMRELKNDDRLELLQCKQEAKDAPHVVVDLTAVIIAPSEEVKAQHKADTRDKLIDACERAAKEYDRLQEAGYTCDDDDYYRLPNAQC